MTIDAKAPAVYAAINAVQAALAVEGITKDRKNLQQGYAFRGIDDVFNAVAPLLAQNKLCILPRYLSRTVTERETAKGGTLFYVIVECELDFVCSVDGSKHTVRFFGEAMDSGDKATNKAMSAAYKYAALQVFSIPTEGDNDADATTHDVKAKGKPVAKAQSAVTSAATIPPPNGTPVTTATPPSTPTGGISDAQRRELRDTAKAVFGADFIAKLKGLMMSVAKAEDSQHLTPDGFIAVRNALHRLADENAAKESK